MRQIVNILVLILLVNYSNAQDATILEYENGNVGLGLYKFRYKTSDGTERQEQGFLENGNLVVIGTYSYIGPDFKKYSYAYEADENGYRQMDLTGITAPGAFLGGGFGAGPSMDFRGGSNDDKAQKDFLSSLIMGNISSDDEETTRRKIFGIRYPKHIIEMMMKMYPHLKAKLN